MGAMRTIRPHPFIFTELFMPKLNATDKNISNKVGIIAPDIKNEFPTLHFCGNKLIDDSDPEYADCCCKNVEKIRSRSL